MNLWITNRIFYSIFTLGFCGVLERGKSYEQKNRFIDIEKWIPHLKEMSINAIYFGPIFESSYHGYDTKDFLNIDKRLGTNEDFKNLCEILHQNDIKIILDGVFNHVGREFWAFKDVQKNGRNSKYCSWFAGLDFNSRSPMGDEFNYESWNGHYNLVKLNLWNREVVDYLLNAVGFWIDEFDIDGLRLDAADKIILEFFKELKVFTKKKKNDFWLMGEIIHGDYNIWANPEMLDSVTNYECYKGIYSSHNDKNYFEIAYSLNRMFGNGGIYKKLRLYNFVDNHDVNRLASILRRKEYLFNVYTILYTMPGIPSIYYGSEYGIEAVKAKNTDDPLRPSAEDIDNKENKNIELFNHIKRLGEIRIHSDALINGDYKQIVIKNEQYVFSRTSEKEQVYVLLNLSDKESILEFEMPFKSGKNLLADEEEIITGGRVNIKVAAFSAKIISEVR